MPFESLTDQTRQETSAVTLSSCAKNDFQIMNKHYVHVFIVSLECNSNNV